MKSATSTDRAKADENRIWRQGFLDAAYMLLRRGRDDLLKAAEELEAMEAADVQDRYFELLQKGRA
jgi:hypothetical protein